MSYNMQLLSVCKHMQSQSVLFEPGLIQTLPPSSCVCASPKFE